MSNIVETTLPLSVHQEAVEYLEKLKLANRNIFNQEARNHSGDSIEQTTSLDLPMDLTICVAPDSKCQCCNCILDDDETRKIIGDVTDPTSLASMLFSTDEDDADCEFVSNNTESNMVYQSTGLFRSNSVLDPSDITNSSGDEVILM